MLIVLRRVNNFIYNNTGKILKQKNPIMLTSKIILLSAKVKAIHYFNVILH